MGKHSYEFSNKAQDRLSAFDASKRVQEDELYWDGLVGNAGKTDFSEDAHQRLLEAQAYHEHRLAMEARDDKYDPLAVAFDRADADFNQEWDAAIEEDRARDEAREAARIEKLNTLDTKIAADPKLRRIQMLSRSIDDLRSQTFTDEDEARKSQMLDAKYAKIEELIRAYENESELSEDELYELLDRTLTPAGTQTAGVETTDSTSASTTNSAPKAPDAEKGHRDTKASNKPEESTPLFDELARQYDLDEATENENLAADADKRALLDSDEDEKNLAADPEHRALLNDDENLAADAKHRALLNDNENENLAASADKRALLNDDEENLAADPELRAMLNDDNEEENLAADPEHRALLDDDSENLAADTEHRALLNDNENEEVSLDHPMTRSERVLAWWNGSRMHGFFEKRRTSKNFNRTAVALGAVVLGAAVASRLGWFHDFGFDPNITPDHHDGTPNPDTGNNGGDHKPQAPKTPDTPAPAPVPTPNPEAILASYEPAFNVPYASGGEDLMKRLGVAPTEWYSKVVPGLLEKYPNDFYPEQVGGYIDVRFDRPGPLPKEIQRDILHRLGKI